MLVLLGVALAKGGFPALEALHLGNFGDPASEDRVDGLATVLLKAFKGGASPNFHKLILPAKDWGRADAKAMAEMLQAR